ncbi:hypothetical protein CXB51_016324 [Gossypium anomalum]|uniref:Uncharacterized protein n=1 Tax=Gossypium anomalum TaxID=47600 RepID=A0A8J5YSW8_9ROSI|nr:hypothetical protein CXB51_016324 [Gossypium anomalum]
MILRASPSISTCRNPISIPHWIACYRPALLPRKAWPLNYSSAIEILEKSPLSPYLLYSNLIFASGYRKLHQSLF